MQPKSPLEWGRSGLALTIVPAPHQGPAILESPNIRENQQTCPELEGVSMKHCLLVLGFYRTFSRRQMGVP